MNWLTRLINRKPEPPKQVWLFMSRHSGRLHRYCEDKAGIEHIHTRICCICYRPIGRHDNWVLDSAHHKDCAHPRLRDPQLDLLPDALSRLPEISKEGM